MREEDDGPVCDFSPERNEGLEPEERWLGLKKIKLVSL